jgi:arylsulfatase A-like enzyme
MAAFAAPLSVAAADVATKPNVILILADDLGYGEVGCYGQEKIRTPQIDRMASQGMRFTQFYAGSTVCAPSRSVLMTGLHMGHTRVRGNSSKPGAQELRDEDVTVAEVLRGAGYATGLVGKWGLGEVDSEGHPNRQGFDYFFGFLNQTHAHNHFPDHLWRNSERVPLPNDLVPVGTTGAGYATKPDIYADDLFFDEAGKFVERHRDGPFFLEISLTIPHANNERSRLLGDGQELPDYGRFEDESWPAPLRGQAAMIERMDARIGALLEQLQQLGIDEKTLIIFTSDNGPHNEGGPEFNPDFFDANGALRGIKRDLTDGGIRVPFIVRWPGRIAPESVSNHASYFGDLMATLADLSGAEAPTHLDSLSIAPTLLASGAQA